MIRSRSAVLLLVLLGACAPVLSRVPLLGAGPQAARLAGEWSGEYTGDGTGRSGSILFRLSEAADSAWGDVTMVPHVTAVAVGPVTGTVDPRGRAVEPQPLAIRFVRIEGDRVEGVLEPYRDPDCGCVLFTTFTGVVGGEEIRGTFTSRGAPGPQPQEGRWSVRRRHAPGGAR